MDKYLHNAKGKVLTYDVFHVCQPMWKVEEEVRLA